MTGIHTSSFAHLHVHTEYSILDGAAKLAGLFAEVTRIGQTAVAITDHGNLFGAFDFYTQATAAGVKPIIGMEAYVAPRDRRHRKPVRWGTPAQRGDDVSAGGAYTHMTLLAETPEGLRNLFRLASLASFEGHYKHPRVDRELLARHAEGLIGTTGCASGEIQTRLRLGQPAEAVQAAADFRDIFGAGNYFLELMDHGLDVEERAFPGLRDIGRQLALPPLATNDSHYVAAGDAGAHDALLCVNSGSKIADKKRFRFGGDGYYLKTAAEMRALFPGDLAVACDNTLLVAERVQSYDEVFATADRMPRFEVPAGETELSWLVKQTAEGLAFRYPDGVTDEARTRADFELKVIGEMGFPGYFLICQDLLAFTRSQGIRYAPGRGSATGSLVAYALRITDLDPLYHGLLFERFLNPHRVTMPDIDLDFDERRRGEVIRYVTDKYGDDKVCQVVTFGTIKTKAALKDAARVHDLPFALADALTKALPPLVGGNDIPLAGIVDPDHPRYPEAGAFRAALAADPAAGTVFAAARGLEGLIRQVSVHACAVIMSRDPLIDIIPMWRRDTDGAIVSGWSFEPCETVGLLKMDFLGLRNLTVIDDAVQFVRAHTPGFDVHADQLDDPATYELFASGNTLGVFQFDGPGMIKLLRAMAPTRFDDIAAVLALYRPGPMAANAHGDFADRSTGRKPIVPIHPELAEPLHDILESTYGLIVFQEQVMAIARKVAGYSLGEADLLRRAMGKKKKAILDKEFVRFHDGMAENGYSDEAVTVLWDILLPFSSYAFNKSHTAGYGIISYWTAYLKANYPTEYMAALLTSVGADQKKLALYLAECRRMGITVLPPDVNESGPRFTPDSAARTIRFGLDAVRNAGGAAVASIVAAREAGGPYLSFEDFLARSAPSVCRRDLVESLIKAGTFDSLGHTRYGLMCVHADAVKSFTGLKKAEDSGQFDLFGDASAEVSAGAVGLAVPIPDREWPRRELLAFEREQLGLYVSDHPLRGCEKLLARHADRTTVTIDDDTPERTPVTLAGMITAVELKASKKDGKRWAIATIEDMTGPINALFFAKTYAEVGEHLTVDSVVAIRGTVSHRDGVPAIYGLDLKILDTTTATADQPAAVTIRLNAAQVTPQLVEDLGAVLGNHPGASPVHVAVHGTQVTTMNLPKHLVTTSAGLLGELKSLAGVRCVE